MTIEPPRLDPRDLKAAARAAIVMPAVIAFADLVIQNPDTTLLAGFGSFAILARTHFGGPRRSRLNAYVALVLAGAVLITLGTLCSQTPWLAVAGSAVVGFVIVYSGRISANFAAAGFAALLVFILPIAVPGSVSDIPARLEGWGLAATVGICALMLIWPDSPRDRSVDAAGRTADPSDWLPKSILQAAGLTGAVLVIQLTSVEHAFWVGLATLSVLRAEGLDIREGVLAALWGTVLGIAVGGGLIYVAGTQEVLLWALLPAAVLLAAYAGRGVSFAAGQAGFSVLSLVIINLIDPTGWSLGLVRAEDVAIGCAISLGVGLLFWLWPRGVAAASDVGRSLPRASGSPSPTLGGGGMAPAALGGESSAMTSTTSSHTKVEHSLPALRSREAAQAPVGGASPGLRPGLSPSLRPGR